MHLEAISLDSSGRYGPLFHWGSFRLFCLLSQFFIPPFGGYGTHFGVCIYMHLGTICISGLYLWTPPWGIWILFLGSFRLSLLSHSFQVSTFKGGLMSTSSCILLGIWHPFSGVCSFKHLGTICISGLYLCIFHQGTRYAFIPLLLGGYAFRLPLSGMCPKAYRLGRI